jgi:hypothetical protein
MTRILSIQSRKFRRMAGFLGAAATALTLFTAPQPAFAQVTAFKQAVAEAAARDEDIAAYYRTHGYAPIWTEATETQRARRAALMSAIRGIAGWPRSR